jgi:hypothetical protein
MGDANPKDVMRTKLVNCENDFIVFPEAYHSVGNSIQGMSFSCRFSFRSPKDVSKTCRMEFLNLLYDNMTKRVNDAYNDLAS